MANGRPAGEALFLLLLSCSAPPPRAAAPQPVGDLGGYRRPDPYASSAHACSSAAEAAALAAANSARQAAGAQPLICLPALSRMAAGHAAYLAANEVASADPHAEQPGLPGYTGASLGLRGAAAGLDPSAFWLSEGVGGQGTPAAVVAAHLGTVYHRSELLTPGARYFAFAAQSGASEHAVLNTLAWVDAFTLAPTRYPAADQVEVPSAFDPGSERPDPVPGRAGAVGFPVSVHFPRVLAVGGEEALVGVRDFTLRDGAQAVVPSVRLTAAADAELFRSDAYLIPAEPLAPGTRYHVSADLTYGAFSLTTAWSFTTAAGP